MARPGYRKLTSVELRRHGFSAGSERYVRTRNAAAFDRTRSKASAEKLSLSRRQYDNLRYVDLGWRSRDDFERRLLPGHADMAGYERWRQAAIAHGIPARQVDNPGSEFNRRFLAARAHNFDRGKAGRAPGSAFARFLVYIGLRDERANYAVGGSP